MNTYKKEYLEKVIDVLTTDLTSLRDETKSPIEELFLLAFLSHADWFEIKIILSNENKYPHWYAISEWYAHKVIIIPQAKIKKFLTVDFKIEIPECDDIIAIECDGHDFHEKTKEQAARDKKRDREITTRGIKILRFSGSEIYNKPGKCILELENLFINIFEKTKKKKDNAK